MEKVGFVSVVPTSLLSPQGMQTVWRVVGKESGKDCGFVASSVYSRVKPNGDISRTVMWGSAVLADEFRSGILFPHRTRSRACADLLRLQ